MKIQSIKFKVESLFILTYSLYLLTNCRLNVQEEYIINYRNLFNQITDNLPDESFDGYVEVIKHSKYGECKTSLYVSIFKRRKKFFSDAIKSIDKYIKWTPMGKKRRCVYQTILDAMKKGEDYINKLFDIKIKWAECSLNKKEANDKFLTLWRDLFSTFSKKTHTKNTFFAPNKKVIEDLPTNKINNNCAQNAPKMFCEFIGFFIYRANIKQCSGDIYCVDRKIKLSDVVSGLYEKLLKEYHGFNEFCSELKKIDYFNESEEYVEENIDSNNNHGD